MGWQRRFLVTGGVRAQFGWVVLSPWVHVAARDVGGVAGRRGPPRPWQREGTECEIVAGEGRGAVGEGDVGIAAVRGRVPGGWGGRHGAVQIGKVGVEGLVEGIGDWESNAWVESDESFGGIGG